jgi:chorismate mutase/prephenate dehydrogenase
MSDPQTLNHLRGALVGLDHAIVKLAGRRQELARRIGRLKDRDALGLRDFAQEKLVLERARESARETGTAPELAVGLLTLLIGASLSAQERQRVEARSQGAGRKALVIGGAGRMGGWFVRFLASQGFEVMVADPRATLSESGVCEDWRTLSLDHDLILVAAPLRPSAAILDELATRRPSGVVCDIGSLKSPLAAALERLKAAGVRVTSLHPLFGPDTELLSGRHVVVVDLGVPDANGAVQALFAPTMAEVVTMDLAGHDRLMASVLGLSHALNLAFLAALAGGGEPVERLARLSSTTFDRQLGVAKPVAGENPQLYWEIQRLNPFGGEVLDRLAAAVERLRGAVRDDREGDFVALMAEGRAWAQPGDLPLHAAIGAPRARDG